MIELLFIALLLNPVIENVKTTGYCAHPPCVDKKWADGRTASNTIARRGVCAANWKVFPKGAVLHIPGYGNCRVEDTGNPAFVNGVHLDLYFEDIEDAREWGVKQKSVIVIEWPRPTS